MENEEPRTLFKYRHFDKCGYGLKALDEVYFSSPENFNDPFDTSIPILYWSSGATADEINNYFMRKCGRTANDFISKIPPNLQDAQALDQKKADKATHDTGVFSLSERAESILMWSHYGGDHKGFCIGYRTRVLYEALKENKKELTKGFINHPMLHRVRYKSESPIINPYDPELCDDEKFRGFTVKHIDWEYEKEWRFIFLFGAGQKTSFPENVIECVYLGMKIEKSNEELLIEKLRNRKCHVNLFRALRPFNSFELKFEKVDY